MPLDVVTRAYDNARQGANTTEVILTPQAIRTRGIARIMSLTIPDDPRLEAQPLVVSGVPMADGQKRDLLLQASMGNTIYAFDANTGVEQWRRNLGRPITGNPSIDAHSINILWGILSTPVVDPAASVLYACAWISEDGTPQAGQHCLAALNLRDGTLAKPLLNLEGAVYAAPGLPRQQFRSAERKQRAALTLTQEAVLIPFGTIAETAATARGWLIAVDTRSWKIAATWCSTVTGSGGGIWQSGAGPAIDKDGAIYVVTGNGDFDPGKSDFGESIVKLRYTPPANRRPGSLTVQAWWAPWTDRARVAAVARADPDDPPRPSNLRLTSLYAHALRMGLLAPEMPHPAETGVISASPPDPVDPRIATLVRNFHGEMMMDSLWMDQDLGAGGPVVVDSVDAALVAGKDGVLFTARLSDLGNTQPADLVPPRNAANYGRLKSPPILYTYYDPAIDPAPADIQRLNLYPESATRHLHGTPVVWTSQAHGLMHFCGGENGNLRAWSLGADGSSTYLACSAEYASPQSRRPPGGMPGWSLTLSANGTADGIVAAMIPYGDANMELTPGRFLVYDAQNFTTYADGSRGLAVLWDSEQWGPEHVFTHPKFNRPIVWNGRIFRPSYDGRVDVYRLVQ
jgi:hypothetical protein